MAKKIKNSFWKVMLTGIKVFVLNIISTVILVFLNFIIGLFGMASILAIGSATPLIIFFAIILSIIFVVVNIYVGGLLARVLYKWK